MAQVSSFDAPVKVASNDLIDSTIGIDPAMLEFFDENMFNEPQYDFFTQLNAINNFTNNWEIDNTIQQFNTFPKKDENIDQNKIGNHLPKSSHTMLLWQRRLNSQKGSNKQFEALHDLHSEIDSTIRKGDSFPSHSPTKNDKSIDPSSALADSDFQMDAGIHVTTNAPAETMCKVQMDAAGLQHKQSSSEDNISSSSNISCSPSSMLNGGLQPIQHESQLQNLQKGLSPEPGTAYIDQCIKNLLSQTHWQDASIMDPSQSFVNLTSAPHNQYCPPPDLFIDTKNRWMDTPLHESKNLESRKSSETSIDASNILSSKLPSSVQTRGEGVIGKFIIPSLCGKKIDGVKLWREEVGQLRHVCPHAGCEKHFSTSGHARRHSRIHDRFRPFRCPHKGCYSKFTRRENCTQYQRARHKVVLVSHRIKDDES